MASKALDTNSEQYLTSLPDLSLEKKISFLGATVGVPLSSRKYYHACWHCSWSPFRWLTGNDISCHYLCYHYHTWLNLEFTAKPRIWQVSAFKTWPWSGYIFCIKRAGRSQARPPTTSMYQLLLITRSLPNFIFRFMVWYLTTDKCHWPFVHKTRKKLIFVRKLIGAENFCKIYSS